MLIQVCGPLSNLAAFLTMLPAWITSSLWRKKDPNALSTTARNTGVSEPLPPLPRGDADLRIAVPCFTEIGSYLGNMLKAHIQHAEGIDFKDFGTPEAVRDAFRSQFIAYTRQDYPFNRPFNQGAMQYWKSLEQLPDSRLMAVRFNAQHCSQSDDLHRLSH